MRDSISRLVIDASAGIKLFIEESDSLDMQRIFERFAVGKSNTVFVPDIFFAECANILWKLARRNPHLTRLAEEHLADLRELRLSVIPTLELYERAFQIATEYGISAYDACYIALAERLEMPLLTADERLARLVPQFAQTIEAAKSQWM